MSATFRRDGSSVFNPNQRYGWFPSFMGSWRIKEESFLRSVDWINELKLRASWGKTGFYGNTDPLNQYTLFGGSVGTAYYDIYGTGNNPVQGFRAIRLGDPRTGWQEDIVTNVGIETTLWDGKLSITIDRFRKKAKGILFQITLPDILGGALPPNVNISTVQNNGFDILVGSKGQLTKDLRWDAALTFSSYKNKILKITDIPFFVPVQSVLGGQFPLTM